MLYVCHSTLAFSTVNVSKLDNMSDINEEQLLQDDQSTNRNQNSTHNDELQNAPKDIFYAFQLFKQYMDVKVDKLENKLIDAQDLISKKIKTKYNIICVGHHYKQTNTYNVNKTCALLQTTEGKDEPSI